MSRDKKFAALRSKGKYCALCGWRILLSEATVEHIIPRSKGGSHHAKNLTVSCQPCNSKRGSDTWVLPKYSVTTGHMLRPDEVKRMMAVAKAVCKNPRQKKAYAIYGMA